MPLVQPNKFVTGLTTITPRQPAGQANSDLGKGWGRFLTQSQISTDAILRSVYHGHAQTMALRPTFRPIYNGKSSPQQTPSPSAPLASLRAPSIGQGCADVHVCAICLWEILLQRSRPTLVVVQLPPRPARWLALCRDQNAERIRSDAAVSGLADKSGCAPSRGSRGYRTWLSSAAC